MRMSEEKSNIVPALVAAQAAIGSRVAKDAKNPHFKSDYATLQQVLGQISEHLSEHGLFLTQEVAHAEGGVTVQTTIMHKSGEWAEWAPIYMPAPKQDAQGYGSAITYARRYALMPIVGLAPADDDGNAAVASTPQTISAEQAKTLRELIQRAEADEGKFLQWLRVGSIEQIPAQKYQQAEAALSKKVAQQEAKATKEEA